MMMRPIYYCFFVAAASMFEIQCAIFSLFWTWQQHLAMSFVVRPTVTPIMHRSSSWSNTQGSGERPGFSVTTATTRTTFRLYGISQARRLVAEGMSAFRQGQVSRSIELFDQAEDEEPRYVPYLWQRGLSYYYVNDFAKARRQFRLDVQVNPLDVEEIVWDIASALRIDPTTFPVPNALSLPPNQADRRPIMAIVYKLFRGQATEAELALFGAQKRQTTSFTTAPPAPQPLADEFYSLFYLALFAEVRQEPTKAEHYMKQSIKSQYVQSIGQADYMTAVAKVHCQLRGWV